eukprot:1192621-Prorocentrum_minimum.AAC.2
MGGAKSTAQVTSSVGQNATIDPFNKRGRDILFVRAAHLSLLSRVVLGVATLVPGPAHDLIGAHLPLRARVVLDVIGGHVHLLREREAAPAVRHRAGLAQVAADGGGGGHGVVGGHRQGVEVGRLRVLLVRKLLHQLDGG